AAVELDEPGALTRLIAECTVDLAAADRPGPSRRQRLANSGGDLASYRFPIHATSQPTQTKSLDTNRVLAGSVSVRAATRPGPDLTLTSCGCAAAPLRDNPHHTQLTPDAGLDMLMATVPAQGRCTHRTVAPQPLTARRHNQGWSTGGRP